MSKIITAIIEENILKKINKNKITENKNILYKEAILDTLKKNKKINAIIISEKIPGEIDLIKIIKKIKKVNRRIRIIIILYNKKNRDKLIKNNINDIYYNNFISINKLIKRLKETQIVKRNKKNNKKANNFKINTKSNLINKKIINNLKIKNLINNLKIKNLINRINYNNIMEKEKNIENKNNVIFIFGKNKIDKKIIELIMIKKLIIKNRKIIIIHLKINNKKINKMENKRIIKKNKRKDKYKYKLKLKIDYKIRENKINKNLIEIININKILKNKNKLIILKIIKKIIKKYNNKQYYIIFNIDYINENINNKKIKILNKYTNLIVVENNEKNLLLLNRNKNKKINLIIINYIKNNISKYFYKVLLKNRYNKIKIINFIKND